MQRGRARVREGCEQWADQHLDLDVQMVLVFKSRWCASFIRLLLVISCVESRTIEVNVSGGFGLRVARDRCNRLDLLM